MGDYSLDGEDYRVEVHERGGPGRYDVDILSSRRREVKILDVEAPTETAAAAAGWGRYVASCAWWVMVNPTSEARNHYLDICDLGPCESTQDSDVYHLGFFLRKEDRDRVAEAIVEMGVPEEHVHYIHSLKGITGGPGDEE